MAKNDKSLDFRFGFFLVYLQRKALRWNPLPGQEPSMLNGSKRDGSCLPAFPPLTACLHNHTWMRKICLRGENEKMENRLKKENFLQIEAKVSV